MRILVLLLTFLFTAFSVSCSGSSAAVTIPANQTFILGEFSNYGYKAKLTNKGSQTIAIELRSKSDQSVISSVQLSPKQSKSFQVAADQLVAMVNASATEAQVSAKMSKRINGMSYTALDGEKIKYNGNDDDENEVMEAPAEASLEGYIIDENAAPAQSRVKATISSGEALVLGEGTSDNYSIDVSKLGGALKVSIRDRRTNKQTQGFGIGNAEKETVNIRPYEVIYLVNTGSIPAVVSVDFSEPVSGERTVEE